MTENMNNGYSQRDSAEHEGDAKVSRSFNRIWKERDSAQPKLLEALKTSTDDSIAGCVCAYGNNGSYRELRREI